AELKQFHSFTTAGVMVFKLLFTVGVIVLLTFMPGVFPTGAITSILPVFIVVVAVMPLFSGNARLPYITFFNDFWNNRLLGGLGVSPLLNQQGKHLWFLYFLRAFVVLTLLGGISALTYFAAGANPFSLIVLAVGTVTTMVVRGINVRRNTQT